MVKIHLSRPDIGPAEIKLVNEVLTSGFLSLGPQLPRFEEAVANYTGVKHAVAVNSGTSGLHLIIRSLEIKDGDEVITTPFSFIASANSILFERAVPVFVDILPDTYNIDPDRIEAAVTGKTKAILPVHVFGQCCEMDKINAIAKGHSLHVVEDACEAIGGELNGQKAGTFGDAAVFAFYPNKQITTGEGGIVVTDNDEVARLCRCMRNQGRSPESSAWLAHERLGYNYRLDELSCAIGVAQMERIDAILDRRAEVAARYNNAISSMEGVQALKIRNNVKMSWFVYVVLLDRRYDRDKVMAWLNEEGIQCRPYFTPIHLQPFYTSMFGYKPGDFPVCEDICQRTIALPFYTSMTAAETECVCRKLKEAMEKFK